MERSKKTKVILTLMGVAIFVLAAVFTVLCIYKLPQESEPEEVAEVPINTPVPTPTPEKKCNTIQYLDEYIDEHGIMVEEAPHYVSGLGDENTFVPLRQPVQSGDNFWESGQFMCPVYESDIGYIEELAPSQEQFLASIEDYVPYRISAIECANYDLMEVANDLWSNEMERNMFPIYYLGNGHFGAYWPEYEEVAHDEVPLWRNGYCYRISFEWLQVDGIAWDFGSFTGLDFDVVIVSEASEQQVLALLDAAASSIPMPNSYCQYGVRDMKSSEYIPATVRNLWEAGYDVQYILLNSSWGNPIHAAMLTDGTTIGYDIISQYEEVTDG